MNEDLQGLPNKLYKYKLQWTWKNGEADIVARSREEAERRLARTIWDYIDDSEVEVEELPE
tara:strand:- start:1110 stop:1292 length:183 start_codon:yes stop_codon:yes gene_type:complete